MSILPKFTLSRFISILPALFAVLMCAMFAASQQSLKKLQVGDQTLHQQHDSLQADCKKLRCQNQALQFSVRKQLQLANLASEMRQEVGNLRNRKRSFIAATGTQSKMVNKVLELESQDLDFLNPQIHASGRELVDKIKEILGKEYDSDTKAQSAINEAADLITQLYNYLSVSSVVSSNESDNDSRIVQMRKAAIQQLESFNSVVEDLQAAVQYKDDGSLGFKVSTATDEELDRILTKAEAACRSHRVTFIIISAVADDPEIIAAVKLPQSAAVKICETLARALEHRPGYEDASIALSQFAASTHRRSQQLAASASLVSLLGSATR
jgi:hypothetical protein